MIRIIALNILVLFAPALLYVMYQSAIGQHKVLSATKLTILLSVGLLAMLGFLSLLTIFNGEKAVGHYVPSHIKDGVIQPGHME